MSTRLRKGLIVAALHLAIVLSLGAKLLIDRATQPRVWARTGPVDPDLPIRGRYVRLQIEAVPAEPIEGATAFAQVPVALAAQDGKLIARRGSDDSDIYAMYARPVARDAETRLVLLEPVAYFIPEHVPDPSRRAPDEELWVEVTVPKSGPPRPIRLGVKKGGVLKPLAID